MQKIKFKMPGISNLMAITKNLTLSVRFSEKVKQTANAQRAGTATQLPKVFFNAEGSSLVLTAKVAKAREGKR